MNEFSKCQGFPVSFQKKTIIVKREHSIKYITSPAELSSKVGEKERSRRQHEALGTPEAHSFIIIGLTFIICLFIFAVL